RTNPWSGKAPPAAGTYRVIGTSAADKAWSDITSVTVTALGAGITVSISPEVASVQEEGTVAFTASVTGAPIGQSDVMWSVLEADGGTVDSSGNYVAPATEGTYHVMATSIADPSRSDTATVTVTSASSIAVSI